MKNKATRTIRSEEITIDVRICAALAANRGSGEVYLAAIAPDMELTVITLDEAPGILPCFEEDDACLNIPDTSLLLLFAEQNGFSAPLTAGIKLRAKVVGGDAISKAFLAATNRVGLSLNYDSQQLTDYRIGCVGTAFRLYKQMGEPLYCETMRLIVAAWEGKPDSFRASVLKGMMHFVELYHGEFSEERLLRALRSIHPVDIYRIGQDDPAKLRGWKKYVFPIYTAYNGKCRKDALPMKF